MARPFFPRLSAYAALLLVALGLVQLTGSLVFYQTIDRQTLREDHARRVAELLVVSDRVHALGPQRTAAVMSTGHLQVAVAAHPAVTAPQRTEALDEIARRIATWEPSLAGRPLHLAIERVRDGRRDLVGSARLADGNWLNFRSRDISSMWPVALRAMVLTLVTSLVCCAFALVVLRWLTRPLQRLSEAADAIGEGRQVTIRESGPADLRNLARSMNAMQGRIAGLLDDQARSFEAISHDLRTPLARQRIAAGLIADAEIADLVQGSALEMEAMLQSLQQFLRAQSLTVDPEPVDLAAALGDLIAPWADRIRLAGPADAVAITYREPLLLALRALIENAERFGDRVEVTILQEAGEWIVAIEDDGPGIPSDHFDDVLAPFFRLDEARSRNTKGFGLGIPTACRLLRRFGGDLSFVGPPQGGLIVRVQVPRPRTI